MKLFEKHSRIKLLLLYKFVQILKMCLMLFVFISKAQKIRKELPRYYYSSQLLSFEDRSTFLEDVQQLSIVKK